MPLVLAAFVLWAYVCSSFAYKTWYVATAAALLVTAILVARRAVRFDGLARGAAPVAVYFAWLLATALWAAFPLDTLQWVAVDVIGLAVFVLFFLAGRNAGPDAIADAMTSVVVPSAIVAALLQAADRTADPTFTRIAPYALALLPFVIPFAMLRALRARSGWPYHLALAAAVSILLLGRSRAHLAVGLLLLVASAVVLADGARATLRAVFLCAALVLVPCVILTALPPTRPAIVAFAVRFARIDLTLAGVHVTPQPADGTRPTLARLTAGMLPSSLPFGIGYMNMAGHFKEAAGRTKSLHNMYATFLLEGGLPCVAIVLFLAWRHVRALGTSIATRDSAYGKALALASAGLLPLGAFHQVQQTPALWLLLGLGACGFEARDAARLREFRTNR